MRRPWKRWSPGELQLLWTRWKEGQTLEAVGAGLGVSPFSVYEIVGRHGGVPQRPRHRSPRVLSLGEREEISRGLRAEESIRAIARRLARAPSSISREVRRHGGRTRYRAVP